MMLRFFATLAVLAAVAAYVVMRPWSAPTPEQGRYTKLDDQGQAMAPWAGPWRCVADEQTGLVWEVKRDDESVHHKNWSYSWHDGTKGKANFGDCHFNPNRCDTRDLIQATNQEALCGRTNWRLPTLAELQSLVDRAPIEGKPQIDPSFFPHTVNGAYWSSDQEVPLTGIFAYHGKGARAMNFLTAEVQELPYSNALYLRLVSPASQAQE